jgi:dihydroorotate dehydrogenase
MTLQECQHRVPVIGVAQNAETALEELRDGASLVQTDLSSLALGKLLKTLEKPSQE